MNCISWRRAETPGKLSWKGEINVGCTVLNLISGNLEKMLLGRLCVFVTISQNLHTWDSFNEAPNTITQGPLGLLTLFLKPRPLESNVLDNLFNIPSTNISASLEKNCTCSGHFKILKQNPQYISLKSKLHFIKECAFSLSPSYITLFSLHFGAYEFSSTAGRETSHHLFLSQADDAQDQKQRIALARKCSMAPSSELSFADFKWPRNFSARFNDT